MLVVSTQACFSSTPGTVVGFSEKTVCMNCDSRDSITTNSCVHGWGPMNIHMCYHTPVTPHPRMNTSALHRRTGGGREEVDRTILKPMCWKKCLRKENLANLEASSPVLIHDPPLKHWVAFSIVIGGAVTSMCMQSKVQCTWESKYWCTLYIGGPYLICMYM